MNDLKFANFLSYKLSNYERSCIEEVYRNELLCYTCKTRTDNKICQNCHLIRYCRDHTNLVFTKDHLTDCHRVKQYHKLIGEEISIEILSKIIDVVLESSCNSTASSKKEYNPNEDEYDPGFDDLINHIDYYRYRNMEILDEPTDNSVLTSDGFWVPLDDWRKYKKFNNDWVVILDASNDLKEKYNFVYKYNQLILEPKSKKQIKLENMKKNGKYLRRNTDYVLSFGVEDPWALISKVVYKPIPANKCKEGVQKLIKSKGNRMALFISKLIQRRIYDINYSNDFINIGINSFLLSKLDVPHKDEWVSLTKQLFIILMSKLSKINLIKLLSSND